MRFNQFKKIYNIYDDIYEKVVDLNQQLELYILANLRNRFLTSNAEERYFYFKKYKDYLDKLHFKINTLKKI